MKEIKEILEFDKIIEIIADYSSTELGRRNLREIAPYPATGLVDELAITDEAMVMNERFGKLPVSQSTDLRLILQKAGKEIVLGVEEISAVKEDLLIVRNTKHYFFNLPIKYKLLHEEINKLVSLDSLVAEITKIIAPDLSVYDHASPALNSIRRKKKNIEQKINAEINNLLKKYEGILSEKIFTLRNNRFVLPVISSEKNKIDGIIQDISSSGQTTFIEPSSIVSFYNELYLAESEEKEEIWRILKYLTEVIASNQTEILANNQIIGYLDYVQAKALFGIDRQGHVSVLTGQKEIFLPDARHPLIDKNKVVANTFVFTPEEYIMIISGPNAGGKTVAVKTVGLCVLMHLCAVPLLTKSPAKIGYFANIYADIGDNQSLADNLSTFAGHMQNLANISKKANEEDLVIIDELGTGTDPKEGEAIGCAFIGFLAKRKITSLVTSHYGKLKELAYGDKTIFNASLLFDEENLVPTYKLKQRLPGRSYGLTVATRYGLNEEIIKEAEKILASDQSQDVNVLFSNIEKELIAIEKMHHGLEEQADELAKEKEKVEKEQKHIDKIRNTVKEDLLAEKQSLISETKAVLDDLVRRAGQGNLKLHEVISLRKEADSLSDEPEEKEISSGEISLGDYIEETDLGIKGTVVNISNKEISVQTDNGKTFKIKQGNFVKSAPRSEHVEVAKIKRETIQGFPSELNLLGYRVSEAIEEVDRYINEALLSNVGRLRIIHGFGTGALKKAVHQYLAACKNVSSFRLGEQGEGGYGATIVFLK